MAMRLQWRAAMLAVCVTLAVVSGGARADEVPPVTGEHWTKSTEQIKKVCLIGIANVIHLEAAYRAANYGRLLRPVNEALSSEMVVPGLEKAG
jgi:hypothetical protein